MAITNVMAASLAATEEMGVSRRSEAAAMRQFEVLLVESLLKPMKLNVAGAAAEGSVADVWEGVLKSYLAQAIAGQHALEFGRQELKITR